MTKLSKKTSLEENSKLLKKFKSVDIQRITTKRIGEIISELNRKLDDIEKYLTPDDLAHSFEKLVRDKNFSNESLIRLLAICLSQEASLHKKNEVLLKAFSETRHKQNFLQLIADQPHAGGRAPVIYLRAEALQIAQSHFKATGKYLSAKEVRHRICKTDFENNFQTYSIEFRKKNNKINIEFADTANPLWLPFKNKYGYLMSSRTVSGWLKKEGLSGPSKKYAKTS